MGKLYAVTWTDENYYRARVRKLKDGISAEESIFNIEYHDLLLLSLTRNAFHDGLDRC